MIRRTIPSILLVVLQGLSQAQCAEKNDANGQTQTKSAQSKISSLFASDLSALRASGISKQRDRAPADGDQPLLTSPIRSDAPDKNNSAGVGITSITVGPVSGSEAAQTLEQVSASGKVRVESLSSPNNDPLNCFLALRNLTPRPVSCTLPAYSFFRSPAPAEFQNMVNGKEPFIQLAPNEMKLLTIETFCVSRKSIKPPPSKGADYTLGQFSDAKESLKIKQIIKSAEQLEQKNGFADVPVYPAMRARKIAQAAIWIYLGTQSEKKEDKVTAASLERELKSNSRHKLGKEELREISSFTKALFAAAESTLDGAK